MEVDISEIAEQMAKLFIISPVGIGMKIINEQNDVQLWSKQYFQHFWSLLDPESYKNEPTLPSGSCVSLFSQ